MRKPLLFMSVLFLAGCVSSPSPSATLAPSPPPLPSETPALASATPLPASGLPTPQIGEVVDYPLPSIYDGAIPPGAVAQFGYGAASIDGFSIHAVSPVGDMLAVGATSGVALFDLPSQKLRSFTPTDFRVTQISWSPTGEQLIVFDSHWDSNRSAGALIDAKTGAIRFPIAEHTQLINSVDWAPDGRSFLTAAEDDLLLIWDADSGQVRQRISTTYKPADRKYAWDSESLRGYIQYASFNADGSKIVNYFWSGADAPSPFDFFTVWDARTGQPIVQYGEHRLIFSATWHPTNPAQLLLFTNDFSTSTYEVSTYDVTARHESTRVKPENVGYWPSMGWTPDGTMALVFSDWGDPSGHATFLDGKTFEARFTIPRDNSLLFYKDLIVVNTSRNHDEDHGPTVWNARTGERLEATIDGIAVERLDGKFIIGKDASGSETAIDANSGTRIDHYNDHLIQGQGSAYSLAWSPDGSQLITAGHAATLWDIKTGEPLESFQAHTYNGQFSDHTSVSWVGDLLVMGEFNGQITVWRPDGPRTYPLSPGVGESSRQFIEDMAISPDGSLIAANTGDSTTLFDMKTRQRQARLQFQGTNLAWSPDSRYLAARALDGQFIVWDVAANESAARIAAADDSYGPPRGLAWSPDGARVAVPMEDQRIIFQPVPDSGPVSYMDVALPGGEASINALAWQGNLLAVAYNVAAEWYTGDPVSKRPRNTIILWDVASGEIVRTLTGHNADIADIAFSPDGALLASVDNSGVTLLWPIP